MRAASAAQQVADGAKDSADNVRQAGSPELMSDERQPDVPGVDADKPSRDPADRVVAGDPAVLGGGQGRPGPAACGGVAFFGFLSLFPAVVAAVLAYGLVARSEPRSATRWRI